MIKCGGGVGGGGDNGGGGCGGGGVVVVVGGGGVGLIGIVHHPKSCRSLFLLISGILSKLNQLTWCVRARRRTMGSGRQSLGFWTVGTLLLL